MNHSLPSSPLPFLLTQTTYWIAVVPSPLVVYECYPKCQQLMRMTLLHSGRFSKKVPSCDAVLWWVFNVQFVMSVPQRTSGVMSGRKAGCHLHKTNICFVCGWFDLMGEPCWTPQVDTNQSGAEAEMKRAHLFIPIWRRTRAETCIGS